MIRARVGVQHHDELPVGARILTNLDHAGDVSCLLVDDEEEDLACHLRLVLQFDHFRYPVGLLRVVECDVLTLEMRDGDILSPGGWIARATQEYVVG